MSDFSLDLGCFPFVTSVERTKAKRNTKLIPTPASMGTFENISDEERFADRDIFLWTPGFECPGCGEMHFPDFPILAAIRVALDDPIPRDGGVLTHLCGHEYCGNPFHMAYESSTDNETRQKCHHSLDCSCGLHVSCMVAEEALRFQRKETRAKAGVMLKLWDEQSSEEMTCVHSDCDKMLTRGEMADHVASEHCSAIGGMGLGYANCSRSLAFVVNVLDGIHARIEVNCGEGLAEIGVKEELVMIMQVPTI